MTKLSVAMIAHNEEKNLARSLPSLQFADEIIVVENDSTDQTVAVAKAHGARVISHPWQGYAQQRNLSIAHTSGDWVLIVDADEVVSPALAAEIKTVISRDEADGYKIPTRNFIAGRPTNHGGWYPDYHLRLVRRSLSHYQEVAIHERIADPDRIGYLENPLLHYTYDSIEHWRQKFDRYTTLEASHGSFSLLRLIFKPPFHFLRRYIWWSGYLDGRLGWIAAAMAARYAFLIELKRRRRTRG